MSSADAKNFLTGAEQQIRNKLLFSNYRAAKEQLKKSDQPTQQEQFKSVVGAYETFIEQRQEMRCGFGLRSS